MIEIDAKKDYTLEEVIKNGLIPWVRSYPTLYNMVTEYIEGVRVPIKVTTDSKIRTTSIWRPWAKKIEKLFIKGEEISIFLNYHDISHRFI